MKVALKCIKALFYLICNCKYDDLYSIVSSKLLLVCFFKRLLTIKAKDRWSHWGEWHGRLCRMRQTDLEVKEERLFNLVI